MNPIKIRLYAFLIKIKRISLEKVPEEYKTPVSTYLGIN